MTSFFLSLFFFAAAVLFWAFLIEPRLFQINRYEVAVSKWLDHPLRILHLSDIHFPGPDKMTSNFFDRLAKETFHFVFVTGDIMDCE